MPGYAYVAVAELDDGSEVVLDLEQRGWADKALLRRTVRWTLLPKDTEHERRLPIVSVAIPPKGRPVFRTRVYGWIGTGIAPGSFRCYAVGYKLGRMTHLVWVMPTGDIEMADGESLKLAELHLAVLKSIAARSQPDGD